MIFYFSGTGNSKWVAEELSRRLNDEALDISQLENVPDLSQSTQIGFVFPIYAWAPAQAMLDFARNLPKVNAFTFGVCTCGEDAGQGMNLLSDLYELKSCYSLTMPSNYIVGSDIEEEHVILGKIEKARKDLEAISAEILSRKPVYRVNEGRMAWIKTQLASKGFNRFGRETKPFYVDSRCNNCGLCEKKCPSKTIVLSEGRPTWSNKCYQCLACINYCPTKAIQYGKKTSSRGRYIIENYL